MSWQQLLDIRKDARREIKDQKRERPTACPNDGEPLEAGPRGGLHCPFDGWRWPEDAR